jgi:hypothetical protein
MSKMITWVVAVVVVAGGIWYFWSKPSSPAVENITPTGQTQTGSQAQASAGASDTALAQDAASIDAQLQAASADSSAAGSFNDTPVDQTQ